MVMNKYWTVVKWLGCAAVFVSGGIHAWVDHLAGFLTLGLGGFAHFTLTVWELLEHCKRIIKDRGDAHSRLVDRGDLAWVADQLVMISEREDMSPSIKAQAKQLQAHIIARAVDKSLDDTRLS